MLLPTREFNKTTLALHDTNNFVHKSFFCYCFVLIEDRDKPPSVKILLLKEGNNMQNLVNLSGTHRYIQPLVPSSARQLSLAV